MIVNPFSRDGATGRRFAGVERRLREALGPLEVEWTRAPRDAERLAREAVRAAHYFDPLDVSDMAEKIGEVLDDKKLRDKLILMGRARVKQFSWDKTARQTLDVYLHALRG